MAQLIAPESRLSTSPMTTIPEQNQPSSAAVPKGSRRSASPQVSPERVHDFVKEILGDGVHTTRVLSFSRGVVGVLHAAALGIHAIGRGMADALGLHPKHAIKQVDRLLRNAGITVWAWFTSWVMFVVAARQDLVVAQAFPEFDADDQATLGMDLVTSHGRATPLLWKTVRKSELRNRRNEYETEVIERLHEILPETVNVTLLADRGFADQKLFA
jgi:hypothetical protein